MAEEKNNRGDVSDAIGNIINDIRASFKLGLGGFLLYWFAKDPAVHGMIGEAFNLAGDSAERLGLEVGPYLMDAKGWTLHRLEAIKKASFTTIFWVILSSFALLGAIALVPSWEIKAALGVLLLGFVTYILHDFWAQTWSLIMAFAVAGGIINKAKALELKKFGSLPSFIINGAQVGTIEGLEFIGDIWKWLALFPIWYGVSLVYTSATPFYQVPGLILIGVLLLPPLIFIPLVWTWEKRPDQYHVIMWLTGGFSYFIIGIMATFPDETIRQLEHGNKLAQAVAWGLVITLVLIAAHLVQRTKRSTALAARGMLPRDTYRYQFNLTPIIITVLLFTLVAGGIFYLSRQDEIFSKVSSVETKHVADPLNRALGTELLPGSRGANNGAVEIFSTAPGVPVGNGWYEYVVEARTGLARLDFAVQRGDVILWDIPDSTYDAYAPSHHEWNERTVFGEFDPQRPGHRLTPSDWSRSNTSLYGNFPLETIRATAPLGGLLLRHGDSAKPVAITAAKGRWKIANPLGTVLPNNELQPLDVGLNTIQRTDSPGSAPHYQLRGTYTIRLKRIPALSPQQRRQITGASLPRPPL